MKETIRADTAKLIRKAGRVTERIRRIEKAVNLITEQVRLTGDFWEGEAGESHRAGYGVLAADIRQTVTKLKGHPVHLLTIAGVYQGTEQDNRTSAQMLPADVLR